MCGSKSESQREEELKAPLKVLQKQDKEERTKKDSAKIDDGCCEPLCSPITCE